MLRKEFLRQAGLGLLSLPLLPYLRPGNVPDTCDVAVLGAGLSGLAAARLLQRAGRTVRVLEAQDRVGGRTWSQPFGDAGAFIDVGGQWIGKGHDRMYALLAEAGTRPFPTTVPGQSLWQQHGPPTRYGGETPPLALLDLLAVQRTLNRFGRLANALPVDHPWQAADARALDQQSLAAWIDHTIQRPTARQLIKYAAEGELCLPTQDVSLFQALVAARATGSFQQAVQVEGGAEQDRIGGGAQTVSHFLHRELGASVRLNTPVTQVRHGAGGIEVGNDTYTVKARKLIIAAPLPVLQRVAFAPALPPEKTLLLTNMTMGSVVKCHALYGAPFWRANGLSGSSTVLDGPVDSTVDNSVPGSASGILTAFVTADRARHLLGLSTEARQQLVLAGLARLFGPEALHPLAYHDYSFSNNPWIGGAYSGYFKPGVLATYGPFLASPCGPIHWAGTETADQFKGYMEGAVLAGERAAREVLAAPAN